MGRMTNSAQMGDIIKVPVKDGFYVVERAEDQGAGIGHHSGDKYPSGHHITARLLNDRMSYAPDNAVLTFYQSGEFDLAQTVLIEQVEVVGSMQRTFVEPAGEAVEATSPLPEIRDDIAEPDAEPPKPVKKKAVKKKVAKKKTAKKTVEEPLDRPVATTAPTAEKQVEELPATTPDTITGDATC